MLKDFRVKVKKWFGFPNYLDVNTFIEDIDLEKDLAKKAPAKKVAKKAPAKKAAKKVAKKAPAKKTAVKKK